MYACVQACAAVLLPLYQHPTCRLLLDAAIFAGGDLGFMDTCRHVAGDGNAQRITGEEQLRRSLLRRCRPTLSARVAGSVDLDDTSLLFELPGLGNLFEERLDVGAEKLR